MANQNVENGTSKENRLPVGYVPKQWENLLSGYERASAELERTSAIHDTAIEAFNKEMPGSNPDAVKYDVSRWAALADRERAIRDTEIAIIVKDFRGRELSPDDFAEISRKAATLVDECLANGKKYDEAMKRLVTPAEKAWEAALDRRIEAQDELLMSPAPRVDALLFKIELLTAIMREAAVDDAERIAAICSDAKRLLTH